MAYFLQTADQFFPAAGRDSLLNGLPVGNYTPEVSQSQGLFFRRSSDFREPLKLYGAIEKRVERILTTFQDRAGNLGVLLSGEKGSGKSLMGREISRRAAKQGIPTVIVPSMWPGKDLADLLSKLSQPAVVFLDEFEKIYQRPADQESLLSLLDGTQQGKHLFIFTVNETETLNSQLFNRPGRIYYRLDFTGLDDDFIDDYLLDNLRDLEEAQGVRDFVAFFERFNFDMLKALVEEMNRYSESASEAAEMLNLTLENVENSYKVTLLDGDGKQQNLVWSEWWGNPLFSNAVIDASYHDSNGVNFGLQAQRKDLESWDRQPGVYRYRIGSHTLTLQRQNQDSGAGEPKTVFSSQAPRRPRRPRRAK